MKNFKKISSVAMSGMLLASVLPTVAFATSYPTGSADDKTFTQYLYLDDSETTVPNVTVHYSVEAMTSGAPSVSIPDAVFGGGATTTVNGRKGASKTVTMNIGNLPSTPSTYTYKVTASTTASGVEFTDGTIRTLELITGYATDNDGVPTGNIKVLQAILKSENNQSKKDGFVVEKERELVNTNLLLTKKVEGNQADTSHYFRFNVEFEGEPGTEFKADYATATSQLDRNNDNVDWNQDNDDGNQSGTYYQTTQITLDETGHAQVNVYLKHNETVKFVNVPENLKYQIFEMEKLEKDKLESVYTTSWSIEGVESGNGTNKSSNGGDKNETGQVIVGRTEDHVTFVNKLNATVDTGVVTTIAPFASMMVVAALGYVAVKAKKHED